MLGGPGSGKGTQAPRLAGVLNVPHISTGDLFRENVENGTRLGQRARRYIEAGELVPDDITRAMVRTRLDSGDTKWGFILDGYPRTRHQAEVLDSMLANLRRSLVAAVYLEVSNDELVARLADRGRDDDNLRTVRTRLRTYHRYMAPLLEHYFLSGLLHEIDGTGSPDEVFARLNGIFREATGFTTI